MKVEIDYKSGFCYGVIRAIEKAESELTEPKHLYSLGDIVHNGVEVNRLENLGLKTVKHADLSNLHNEKLLIRAHGEPPSTYKFAADNNITIVDCTCPVVLKLQQRIKQSYEKVKDQKGQIVIFGKKNHAEVNGLVGQVNGDAIVVETAKDLDFLDYNKPILLFSQTTKSPEEFAELSDIIRARMIKAKGREDLIFFETHNTICGQMSSRKPNLEVFAQKHDVIVFVSGKQSSNGKVLYAACKSVNDRSFFVEDESDLQKQWFENAESVGVCGATSTPKWLMDKIADIIKSF